MRSDTRPPRTIVCPVCAETRVSMTRRDKTGVSEELPSTCAALVTSWRMSSVTSPDLLIWGITDRMTPVWRYSMLLMVGASGVDASTTSRTVTGTSSPDLQNGFLIVHGHDLWLGQHANIRDRAQGVDHRLDIAFLEYEVEARKGAGQGGARAAEEAERVVGVRALEKGLNAVVQFVVERYLHDGRLDQDLRRPNVELLDGVGDQRRTRPSWQRPGARSILYAR